MLEVVDVSLARFAQEEERRRIARELHDSAVQSLTALVADLEYFRSRRLVHDNAVSQEVEEKLEMWQELARASLTSMRQTLGNLRSSSFGSGLEQAISKLLDDFHGAGYTLTYECTDWPTILPPQYTMHLYSIVREALININKHAQASHITVFLFSHENRLHVSITDNGVGMKMTCTMDDTNIKDKKMDAQRYLSSGYQQGLVGMQERAMLLGGRCTIESLNGRGTRVDIDVPLPPLPNH